MVQQHNACVECAGGSPHARDVRPLSLSSRLLTPSGCLAYSVSEEIEPFITSRCTAFARGGEISYDFERLERFLLESFFAGLDDVVLQQQLIAFSDDAASLSALRAHVAQKPVYMWPLPVRLPCPCPTALPLPAVVPRCCAAPCVPALLLLLLLLPDTEIYKDPSRCCGFRKQCLLFTLQYM